MEKSVFYLNYCPCVLDTLFSINTMAQTTVFFIQALFHSFEQSLTSQLQYAAMNAVNFYNSI